MRGMKHLYARNESRNPVTFIPVALVMMYLISGMLLLLLAFLLYKFGLSESVVRIGIIVIYIASCFAGGFLTGKHMGEKKFLWGLVTGAVYAAVLFLVSWFFRQRMDATAEMGAINAVTTLILCAVSSMVGGMFS